MVKFARVFFVPLFAFIFLSSAHALSISEQEVSGGAPTCVSAEDLALGISGDVNAAAECLGDGECSAELSMLSAMICDGDTPPPSVDEQIKKLLDDLYKKWKDLPSCSVFGHSKNEVWERLKDWLKKIGFPGSFPGVISPDKEAIEKFLRELDTFLKNKKYGDFQDLIDRLKKLYKDDPDYLKILKELEKLIQENKDKAVPQEIIDKLKDIIRKLILGDKATAMGGGPAVGLACYVIA